MIAAVDTTAVTMAMIAVALFSWSMELDELDLRDFVVALAGRSGHFHFVADLAPDQRSAQRRVIADPSDACVGLLLPNQLVADPLVVLVNQRNGRPEHHLVAGKSRRIDH